MAPKKRQQAAKASTGGLRARRRSRGPGKRPVEPTAGQRKRARDDDARRVLRVPEAGAAGRRAAEPGTPLAVAFSALIDDTFRLLRTLVVAPFRLAGALRHLSVESSP